MLKILKCPSPQEKASLLESFNPKTQAWVVSDLQSKWHLQKLLLQKESVLEEQSILRASELWRKLAVQLIPGTRLLSSELAQSLFWHWLEPLQLSWLKTPQSLSVLMQQMRQWVGVFADPNYIESMAGWFKENPESYIKWGQWFEVSQIVWQKCAEEKVILPQWLPALLLQQDLSSIEYSKDMIFDLGVQMTPVEAMLIKELARDRELKVLEPSTVWSASFYQPMYGYQLLNDEGKKSPAPFDWSHLANDKISFARYSTRVAEVKAAVSQVRKWLDSGVALDKVGILAPDIEEHWPILKSYLEQEGIPVRKGQVARLHSFPAITKWLAGLRLACEQVSTADLETSLFLQESELAISYEEFRVLYSSVYGPQDLERSEKIKERWENPRWGHEPLTQQEFFISAARFWRGGASAQIYLEKLSQFITQDCPGHLKLKPKEWLGYWQGILSRIEVPVEEEPTEGIWCVSLSSTDWLNLSHGYFLNLSAASLRSLTTSPVSFSELEKLSQDLGYPVDSPDRQQSEFEFLWLCEKEWTAFVGSFAQTDTEGNVLTPSRLWLWGAHLHGAIPKEAQSPGSTRWDEVQRAEIPEIAALREWDSVRSKNVVDAVARDEGKVPQQWPPLIEIKLSASALEDFYVCPFIFTAKRILNLSDNPVLDLDLDRMSRGRLMHALFAKLMVEPVRFDWSRSEIEKLIAECIAEEKIILGEPELWSPTINAHVALAMTLLEMEKAWREKFPSAKTVGIEKDFQVVHQSEHGPVTLRGRIDRIDTDGEGRYTVIDYKSSSQNTNNWSSWLKNDSFQMALYLQVIELGLEDLPAGEVESAQYYVVKQQLRHKGFFLKEASGELFDLEEKRRNWMTKDDKGALKLGFLEKLNLAVGEMKNGHLGPRPKDVKTCTTCHWSGVCRSSHLN